MSFLCFWEAEKGLESNKTISVFTKILERSSPFGSRSSPFGLLSPCSLFQQRGLRSSLLFPKGERFGTPFPKGGFPGEQQAFFKATQREAEQRKNQRFFLCCSSFPQRGLSRKEHPSKKRPLVWDRAKKNLQFLKKRSKELRFP